MSKIIAFQGFSGAYSDLACRKVFPDAQTMPCETFDSAFDALAKGKADLAMIPVDNTLAGRVADVHRLMPESKVQIIGEHFQPIQHALMSVKDSSIEEITTVHSHIHALPQCQKIIKQLNLQQQVHADTAGAAKEISELKDPTQAAIASSLAAEIYNLKILKDDVQDADHNTTRFLILSKEAYVGETTDAYSRMKSHLKNDKKKKVFIRQSFCTVCKEPQSVFFCVVCRVKTVYGKCVKVRSKYVGF